MNQSFVFIFTSTSLVLASAACTVDPDGTNTDTTTTTTTSHTTSSSHSGGSGGAGGSGGQGGSAPEVNELRWTPPQGHVQQGEVIAIGYTEEIQDPYAHWTLDNPICVLSKEADGSYTCPLMVSGANMLPPGRDLYYTVYYEDSACPQGGGWTFDQGSYTCGACEGEQACCGKSFGDASITLGSVKLAQEPVLNNTVPCVYNMKVHVPLE